MDEHLTFGNVLVGKSRTEVDWLANHNSAPVVISAIQTSSPAFQVTGVTLPLVVPADQRIPFQVEFQPTTTGVEAATIAFLGQDGQPYVAIQAEGNAVNIGVLSASPSPVTFTGSQIGSSQTATVTLSNTGDRQLVILKAVTSGTGFTMRGLTLPVVLHRATSPLPHTVQMTVTFDPATAGSSSGSITFETKSEEITGTFVLPLSGSGLTAGSVTPAPASLNFGSVQVGSNSSLTETLTNPGQMPITISQATASGTGFSVSGLSMPMTLNAGQSTSFAIVFAPSASGAASGSLSIVSNASSPSMSIPIAGMGVAPATKSLIAGPASLSFGSVQVGSNSSLSETLTNPGNSAVTISQAAASGAGFSISGISLPATLNAGQSTTFNVIFAPTASGAATGSVSIASNGSNSSLVIPLAGTAAPSVGLLASNPPSLSFGSVQVGGSANLNESLTNTGAAPITISQANLSGGAFTISGLTLPVTLNANQSITFTATFTPTTGGAANASLAIASNASNPALSIAFAGTGAAPGGLAVSPSSLSFGNVAVGATGTLTGSLTASNGSVTVNSAGLSNGEFALSGVSLPLTLTSGQSATFTITFAPSASGAVSGSLAFVSNASNSPAVESITGTGTAPIAHSVDLSWNPSNDAAGYNVYRGSVSGGPYALVSTSLDPGTAFTDTTVVAGETYYYVTTAVDSESNESGYSNEAQAVIPTP